MPTYTIVFEPIYVTAGCEDEAVTKAYRMVQDDCTILRVDEVEEN